MYTKVKG